MAVRGVALVLRELCRGSDGGPRPVGCPGGEAVRVRYPQAALDDEQEQGVGPAAAARRQVGGGGSGRFTGVKVSDEGDRGDGAGWQGNGMLNGGGVLGCPRGA